MDHATLPDVPDEDAFRALARSSPWRWRTLRFIRREVWPRQSVHARDQEVRAWLRRPDRLRVEDVQTGDLLAVSHDGPHGGGWLTTDGGQPREPLLATDAPPDYRSDGLVARRPFGLDADAPMFGGYQWVAMLDPVELADGRGDQPGVRLGDLAASEHHGRRVWDAIATPSDNYEPRCSCCPLLLHTETELPPPPDVDRATAHHVRLDVETGVCVHVLQIGGTHDGWHFDVEIETVNEPMSDELFPKRGSWRQ